MSPGLANRYIFTLLIWCKLSKCASVSVFILKRPVFCLTRISRCCKVGIACGSKELFAPVFVLADAGAGESTAYCLFGRLNGFSPAKQFFEAPESCIGPSVKYRERSVF